MRGKCFFLLSLFIASSQFVLAQTRQPMLAADVQPGGKTATASSGTPVKSPPESKAAVATIVRSTVQVNANEANDPRETQRPTHATAEEIQSSAGTYGDFSRYLQLFPGVVFNSDESDDLLVRGGNPIENLFLFDGIEVPNINHIATGATTGGLVSMIDTGAIDSIDFQDGGYDASYSERLSSVISIHPRELQNNQPYAEADVGFVGAGIIRETPFRRNGVLLLSAHRSLLNLFTNNIGLNGVPIYTNLVTRARWEPNSADSISADSIGGIDTIRITPQDLDNAETNTINTQYDGWRMTNGLRWRHVSSPRRFGTVTLSDSEQEQAIHQQDQLYDNVMPHGYSVKNLPPTTVYSELTHEGVRNVRYDGYYSVGPRLTALFGASAHLTRIAYNVAQPLGEQSPLSDDPTRSDATSFAPHFWTGDSGYYTQLTSVLGHWILSAGGRAQTFVFGGNVTATPRISASYGLAAHARLFGSLGKYAQLPPFLHLTSYPQNYLLKPIVVRQINGGIDLIGWDRGNISLEVYQKNYTSYPVSTQYPSLSLANMVDTLGQEFLWIPLASKGTGLTRGIELSGKMHIGGKLFVLANLSFARSLFSGIDRVMRIGNLDYPIVFNAAGRYVLSSHSEFSFRYEATSGRPYTPYLLSESVRQNRPIYDLTRVNAERGPMYRRLDFRVSHTFTFGSERLVAYGGLENAFDRQNFLGIAWLPRYGLDGTCKADPNKCVSYQSQMGIFPNFGVSYRF